MEEYCIVRNMNNIVDSTKDRDVDVRIDSRCVSDKIYKDENCDCLDQFFGFCDNVGGKGIVVYILIQNCGGILFYSKR